MKCNFSGIKGVVMWALDDERAHWEEMVFEAWEPECEGCGQSEILTCNGEDYYCSECDLWMTFKDELSRALDMKHEEREWMVID